MMLRWAVGIALLVVSTSVSAAATGPLDGNEAEDSRAGSPAAPAIWERPAAAAPVQVVSAPAPPAPAPPPPAPQRALGANPLWAIPLGALAGARDRPIFSASRRPIPPAVAPAAAPKVVAIAKPRAPE